MTERLNTMRAKKWMASGQTSKTKKLFYSIKMEETRMDLDGNDLRSISKIS